MFRISKIFAILSGIASLLGFGVSIVFTYSALTSNIESEFKDIIVLLSISMTILLFSVVFIFAYYFKEVENLNYLPKENLSLKIDLKRVEILVKNMSEYIHNISHYYRNLFLQIEDILKEPDDKNIKETLELFDKFLNTLTSNLQSFFTLFTGDNCAVTIKVTNYNSPNFTLENMLVKTFYRDPISYRKRKKSDYLPNANIKIYKIEDNTAFKVISSPKWKNTTYLCDDLRKRWENGEYENKTYGWMNLYNATAVVPIARRIDDTSRRILGFLCVDNFAGNLANSTVENFLSGIADMLYPLFHKYEKLVNLSNERGIFNERAKAFSEWNYSN